ncbi:MAG: hypothetical protein DRQ99_27245 [Candidatus Parabeggiatoa sp. nov. 3]|nr:MAG: hypothetical protein DRQ99_27245 [Gammaproteobacteria bacterium]
MMREKKSQDISVISFRQKFRGAKLLPENQFQAKVFARKNFCLEISYSIRSKSNLKLFRRKRLFNGLTLRIINSTQNKF